MLTHRPHVLQFQDPVTLSVAPADQMRKTAVIPRSMQFRMLSSSFESGLHSLKQIKDYSPTSIHCLLRYYHDQSHSWTTTHCEDSGMPMARVLLAGHCLWVKKYVGHFKWLSRAKESHVVLWSFHSTTTALEMHLRGRCWPAASHIQRECLHYFSKWIEVKQQLWLALTSESLMSFPNTVLHHTSLQCHCLWVISSSMFCQHFTFVYICRRHIDAKCSSTESVHEFILTNCIGNKCFVQARS